MDGERKKITILTLRKRKRLKERISALSVYDYPLASLADRAGVDLMVIGDSVGMTTLGYKSTIPVTMDQMISHSRAVCNGTKYAFTVGDMPFMSFQPSDRDAVLNAGRFIQEAGCDAVKCEGGKRVSSRVKAISDSGILVMGHLGLTPQSIAAMGGYKVQGKTEESYSKLLEDAISLEEAGASFLLLEAVPREIAARITEKVSIPVYGIGAGDKVDGQLVIVHDILGLFEAFRPRFTKRYCEAGELIEKALGSYVKEVKEGKFPSPENFYEMNKDELKKILDEENKK